MSFLFRPCELEMDYEAYIRFLLQHHDELNLPYSLAVKLSFISSPLLFGKAMLIVDEELYQFVGAAGFVYGTGANSYEDRHICQIEVAFIQREYRGTTLFVQGILALLDQIKAGNPDVELVQFWTSVDDKELQSLFSKWGALPGSSSMVVNDLILHKVPIQELVNYMLRFQRLIKA